MSINPNLFIIILIPSQFGKILEFQLTRSRFCEKNRPFTWGGLKDFTTVQNFFYKIRRRKLNGKCVRFNVYRISRESWFGTGESWKEDLSNPFSVAKKGWFGGKCIGGERASKITDSCFEKRRKVISLWILSELSATIVIMERFFHLGCVKLDITYTIHCFFELVPQTHNPHRTKWVEKC